MLINWFTVFAQIFNFLILVVLLRRFLYKPILKVMHRRQAQIDARWQEAEQLQIEAQRESEVYRQQRQELQHQQETLLTQARMAAEKERQRLLAQIHQDLERLRATWQEDLRQEQEELLRMLRQGVMHQTYAIARQALTELANVDLEQQMIGVFCDRLRQRSDKQRQAIAQALQQSDRAMLVRSSFAIPLEVRQQVIEELRAQFAIDPTVMLDITFDIAPELLCGIEIKLDGQEIVWSLDTYLQTLEQWLSTALTQERESRHERHIHSGAGCLP